MPRLLSLVHAPSTAICRPRRSPKTREMHGNMSPLGRNVSVHSPLSWFARRSAARLLVSGSRPKGGAAVAVSSHLCGPIALDSSWTLEGKGKKKKKKLINRLDFLGGWRYLENTCTVVQPPLLAVQPALFFLTTAKTPTAYSDLLCLSLLFPSNPSTSTYKLSWICTEPPSGTAQAPSHKIFISFFWTRRRSPCIVSIVRLGSFDSFPSRECRFSARRRPDPSGLHRRKY